MSFLKGLAGPGMILPTQVPMNPSIANIVPKTVREVGNDALFLFFIWFCDDW